MNAPDFFNPEFIQQLMQQHTPDKNIRVLQVLPLEVDNSASILVALTAGRTEKAIGHFGLEITFEANGETFTKNMVMKIKPHGNEIVEMLNFLASACGGELPAVYDQYKSLTGFQQTHRREPEIYGKMPSNLTPEIYGLHADASTDTYIILMEYLQEVELLNSVMTPEKWSDTHIRTALKQMAAWHASHLEKEPVVNQAFWSDAPSLEYMQHLAPLWEKLLQNATEKFPELYTPERTAYLQEAISQIPVYWQELAALPKTLVHNDLNPRNSCFKSTNGHLQFCVYDWELATFHIPQYDIVEFLSFVLDADRYHLRAEYLEFYRQELCRLTGRFADAENFRRGFGLAALDFGLHRLGMYMMAHSVSPYPFLPRVVNSFFNTLEQFNPLMPVAFEKVRIEPLRTVAHL